jgi:hypothetical protein
MTALGVDQMVVFGMGDQQSVMGEMVSQKGETMRPDTFMVREA